MSKLYRHPIEVKTGLENMPVEFQWRGLSYQVAHCTVIEYTPAYFEYKPHIYLPRYRCFTEQGLVCDLYCDGAGWVLERVWD